MVGTFTKLYIQVICIVKNRNSFILPSWEEYLFQYISGIVSNKDQKMLAINGMPDHIHFLIGMRPSCKLSNLVQEVKKSSNLFINKNNFIPYKFEWQDAYAAFSYTHWELGKICNYIGNQKLHHKNITLKEEYMKWLDDSAIECDDKFLPTFFD